MATGNVTATQTYPVHAGNIQYTVQSAPNQHVVLYSQPQRRVKRVLVDFDSKKSHALGITQIVFGILSIIFVAVAIPMEANIKHGCGYGCFRGTPIFIIGFGYWCPIFFFISGSIALAAAKQKTSTLINALLGMSIISLIFAFQLFISSAIALAHLGQLKNRFVSISFAMALCLMVCGMFEIGTSIWLSKLCGDHVCCTGMHRSINQESAQVITTRNPDGSISQNFVTRQQIMFPSGPASTTYTGQVTALANAPFPQAGQMTQTVYPQGVPVANANSVYPWAPHLGQPGTCVNAPMAPGGQTNIATYPKAMPFDVGGTVAPANPMAVSQGNQGLGLPTNPPVNESGLPPPYEEHAPSSLRL